MDTLGLIANSAKPRAAEVLRRIVRRAKELRLNLIAEDQTASLAGGLRSMPLPDLLGPAQAVMALGGDGTLLSVVRAMGDTPRPVIGVNIGGLGFLTSVAEDDLDRALESLARDDFVTVVSSVLSGSIQRDGRTVIECRALNDLVVTRGPSARAVTLEVAVNGDRVTSYLCDGLIVATPLGSTGHALSSGGPIVAPQTPAFVICPMCPHTLSSRPLVVPDDGVVSVWGTREKDELILAADGQVEFRLKVGDVVTVRRAPVSARLIRLPGHSYFGVLRQKLHWSGSSV